MIPLRDVIPSRTTPWVTLSLLAANALVFTAALALDAHARLNLYFTFGLVPGELAWTSLVTSLFLHNGWLHLGSNLLALWIFGENVEDRMGHARFLAFYVLCGIAGALLGSWTSPDLVVPIVGPGAAIAGVIGAYFAMFPHSRLLVLLPLVVVIDVIEIPAVVFAAFWAVMQLVGDVGRIVVSPGDSAFVMWTHAGGFVTGLVAVWIFRQPERLKVDWWT
ncbi:MAG TPA: rhomboid family intramembrane serine protease [Vicinamibacterales bacterium]|nr:rhomboid family intramembrane serine protease [Vicinamibacterales bacterium]